MTELWRPVLGYEGLYEVSDHGRVRSLDRITRTKAGHNARFRGQLLTLNQTQGKLWVGLSRGDKQSTRAVHRLVLDAFVGPRPDGLIGCHNDGNAFNNNLSNLRWDTYSSNTRDSVQHGTHYQHHRTHCKNGHLYTEESLRPDFPDRNRECRVCRQQSQRRYRQRRSQARRSAA